MKDLKVTTCVKRLLTLRKSKRVIRGGTSAGKTFGIIFVLIDRAIRQPDLEVSVVSISIPHLKRGAIKDFTWIMKALGRWSDDNWHGGDFKYTFSNGSYMEFFSVDQESKVRGARRDILYVNECNLIPFETYHALMIRTRKTKWLDYNPVSRFWVDEEVLDQEDVDFITVTYKDNEALDQNTVKEIEAAKDRPTAYWQNWWKVYGLGQIGTLEGACIPDFEQILTVPTTAELCGFGMDFGFTNDPTVCMAMYKWNQGYIFDQIIHAKNLRATDISKLLYDNEVHELIWADPSEPRLITELEDYGHQIVGAPRGKAASITYGLDVINRDNVFITSRSKETIQELNNYVYVKDKENKTTNRPVGINNHSPDAMRYVKTGYQDNPYNKQYFLY